MNGSKTKMLVLIGGLLLVAFTILPGLGTAAIGLISMIVGNEESFIDHLREWLILAYPGVTTAAVCVAWIALIDRRFARSFAALAVPIIYIAIMLCFDCHPFMSLFILPDIFRQS